MVCYSHSRACPGSYVVLKGEPAVKMDTEPPDCCSRRLYCEAGPGADWKVPRSRFSGEVYQLALLQVKGNCITFSLSEGNFYVFSQGGRYISFRASCFQDRYVVGVPELSAGVA